MKSVRVDPESKTARAEPGVTWGEFDHETQAFGQATTGGLVSTTGIAGLTLGGGLGWLMGNYGLGCDNLISVDLVTADGRLLTASKSRNEDLLKTAKALSSDTVLSSPGRCRADLRWPTETRLHPGPSSACLLSRGRFCP
jgi:FAD/FMN-containing dehydrogenase